MSPIFLAQIWCLQVSILMIHWHCFTYLICTCTTLISIQKDPGLPSPEFPRYANVAEMVKKMSVASLFHHEGCSKQAWPTSYTQALNLNCNAGLHHCYFSIREKLLVVY